ncbi:MAG: PKD domain-containing protein, partial [Bacteroidota bacterium]
MKKIVQGLKILSVFLLTFTYVGCEDDDDAQLPSLEAGFTFTQDQDTGVVTFLNTSTNADSYSWNFGDDTSSTEINPTKIYAANGTFTVMLTASNAAGASDTFQSEVTINIPEPPTPLALPITFDGSNVAYDAIVGDNIGFSVVTNPETGNENTTNVAQMVAGGGQFQNAQFPLGTPVDFSGENKNIQLELFSATEIAVLVKFEDGTDGARDVEVLATHTGSGWETLNFNFATNAVASFIPNDPQNGMAMVPDGQYGKLILFVGFAEDPAVTGTFLVDNISQTMGDNGGGMATEPTMVAPMPTQDAANVISVFSNAYTDSDGTNFRAFGNDGGAELSEIQVAGDDVLRYANTNFVGLQNDTGFNLSGATNFHMDIWVAEDASFRAGLISFTDPATREDVEVNLMGGQWNTIDVALTALVPSIGGEGALPDDPTINQIIFDVLGDGVEADIFVDNIFFYSSGGAMATEPTTAAPTPTQDAANVVSVFSDAYTDVAGTNPRAFGNDPNAVFSEIQVASNAVWSYDSTNFVGTQNDAGFDLTGLTNFSMDIWVAENVGFRAGLISFTDPATREDVEVNLSGGQWNNIDVAITDLIASAGSEGALPDNPTINQIIFDVLGDGVEANIFVDNIYFYNANTGGGGSANAVYEEDFSTDTSANWTPLADAVGKAAEVNVNYLADDGETNGGLEFVLADATGGAFIHRLQVDGIDFSGVSEAEFKFSLRLSESLVNTAIQSQLQVLGTTNVDISENNLETKGLND